MPAYLKFYDLEHSPFEDGSHSKVVLGTKALRDALARIRSGLEEGAARICVNGQSGLGKTSLARALPKLLEEPTRVAVILDPTGSWETIRSSLARQWRVGDGGLARSNLVSFSDEARLVLVLDQAEKASADILDHLDVMLSYRSERDEPVVQSVLFANLSAREEAEPAPLIWWLDRIQTLELQFAPLPREGVASYIEKHLNRAGWKDGSLFDADAAHAIHGYTSGIPGEVDRVCDQLLGEAARLGKRCIDAAFVREILDDIVNEEVAVQAEDLEDQTHEEDLAAADSDSMSEDVVQVETDEPPLELVDVVKDADHTESADESEESEDRDEEYEAAGEELESDDASLIELEAYLSRPPSDDELREIRGHGFAQLGLRVAAVVLFVAFGSTALIWLNGSKTGPRMASDAAGTGIEIPAAESNPTLFAGPDGLSTLEPPPEPLARLRGPLPQAAEPSRIEQDPARSKPELGLPSGSRFFDTPPAAIGGYEPADPGPP